MTQVVGQIDDGYGWNPEENQWMENGEKGKKRKREKERGGKGWVDGREGKRQVTWNP